MKKLIIKIGILLLVFYMAIAGTTPGFWLTSGALADHDVGLSRGSTVVKMTGTLFPLGTNRELGPNSLILHLEDKDWLFNVSNVTQMEPDESPSSLMANMISPLGVRIVGSEMVTRDFTNLAKEGKPITLKGILYPADSIWYLGGVCTLGAGGLGAC